MVIAILAILDVLEPVAQMSADRRDHGLWKLAGLGEGVKSFERRLDCELADLELLFRVGLSLTASGVGEAEQTDHCWQRQAFADQGHENDGEGENENEIAVWECTSVGDSERDRKRRGE